MGNTSCNINAKFFFQIQFKGDLQPDITPSSRYEIVLFKYNNLTAENKYIHLLIQCQQLISICNFLS